MTFSMNKWIILLGFKGLIEHDCYFKRAGEGICKGICLKIAFWIWKYESDVSGILDKTEFQSEKI